MGKFLIFITFFCSTIISVLTQGPLVTINNGVVMGKTMSTASASTPFSAFMGIPYAKPPLGTLRFEPPQPADNWPGIFYANQSSAPCVQGSNSPHGTEDCLRINVFAPTLTTNCPSSQMNVLVFIHGGGFSVGDSSYETLNQDSLMEVGCMVSVTFTYRLGCIGFLSSGDLALPGNLGLKDQVLALQWVHDNIAYFGGNPNNVTIMGQSAGAVSVGLHVETANAGVLFHAAIIESGSSLCDWGRDRSVPTDNLHTLVSLLSLAGGTTQQIKEQLKGVDAYTLQNACDSLVTSAYVVGTPRDGIVFSSVVEPAHPGAFKTLVSEDLWEKGLINPGIPIMIGATGFELNFGTQNLNLTGFDAFSLIFRIILLKGVWDIPSLTPVSMNENNLISKSVIGLQIRNLYNFPLNPLSVPSVEQEDELNDDMFYRPVMRSALLAFLNNLKTYVYIFNYCGDHFCMSDPNRFIKSPSHAEDLNYIYTNGVGMSARDANMKNTMSTLIGNFVKYHDPTISGLPFTWAVTDANLRYLDINDISAMVPTTWRKSYLIDFWQQLFTTKGHPPFDTY